MEIRDDKMPKEMRAVVIDRFGGPEVLSMRNVPVPEIKPEQILVQVESAGVGIWDLGEREGMVAKILGIQPSFLGCLARRVREKSLLSGKG